MREVFKLQNGNDIRGYALDFNETKANLEEVEVESIAKGFYSFLKNRYKKEEVTIAVGIDSRVTGEKLKNACVKALINCGCNVIDCGLSATPAMFMTTLIEDYKCDGAIMLTASHLPYYYNGMKFFKSECGIEKEELKEILSLANNEYTKEEKGSLLYKNLLEDYSEILREKIKSEINCTEDYDKPLKGLKIIVDAGNGAGGFFEDLILKKLGADTKGSQFLNPDGTFPNHVPNPENNEAMKSICEATLKNNGDLGVIFDTDVDRAGVVDRFGNAINKNSLIALASAIVLEEIPRGTIVTDSITSSELTDFILKKDGKHHRFKRGYKNVINEGKRLNSIGEKCDLAIETSGHVALKENYFLDDGAYLVSKIIIKMAKLKREGKFLEELIKDLKYPLEEKEIRVEIKNEDYKVFGERLLDDFKVFAKSKEEWTFEEKNYEGVRINFSGENKEEKGWFLVRTSLHEPLIVINIESNKEGISEKQLKAIKEFLINNGITI